LPRSCPASQRSRSIVSSSAYDDCALRQRRQKGD
jgi:hypothetical protein